MPTVLVTGAGRGIGVELVRQYAAEDWRVIATLRDPSQGVKIGAFGKNIEIHMLDMADRAAINRLANELRGQPIDELLCNAALYGPRDRQGFGQVDLDAWLEVLRVNVLGPMALAEAFVENVASSERKLIAMFTSQMGSTEQAGGGAYIYRSSKAALNNIVRNLAIDLASRGITVIAVVPGWVKTDMGGPGAQMTPEDSVRHLRALFKRVRRRHSGKFLNYDGREIPW